MFAIKVSEPKTRIKYVVMEVEVHQQCQI